MAKLQLDDAAVRFRIDRDASSSLKSMFIRTILRRPYVPKLRTAIDGLTLRLRHGDRIGVIGHNGAGKSTLLRVLAGIYPPTSGSRIAEGRVSSLFDVALGFDPESNGWDNIRYRGYLQGETPQSMTDKMDQIVDFCALGDALDIPVRCYSSGMMLRLAFGVATAIQPEILLVDEAMAAGDIAFQEKANKRIVELIGHASLVVAVSHDLVRVQQFFPLTLWMDRGRARMFGPTEEVVAAYMKHMEALAWFANTGNPITPEYSEMPRRVVADTRDYAEKSAAA